MKTKICFHQKKQENKKHGKRLTFWINVNLVKGLYSYHRDFAGLDTKGTQINLIKRSQNIFHQIMGTFEISR